MITLQPMNIQSAAADLLWSRVLKTYPDLRIALSEGGTGWIPYFLDRVDRTYEMHHAWTQQDFGGRLPSEVFREHFLTCFISDPVGVELRERIGVEQLMADEHLRARGTYLRIDDDDFGPVTVQAPVAVLSETPGRVEHLGRALGADNDAVFGGLLGLDADRLAELRAASVI
jgi:hypothetical protein